jgi:hypothetical protein
MTLHIIGIDKDPVIGIDKDPDQAREQFWTSAGDILIDLANIQSHIGQTVDDVIAAGGDIEITAHNEPDTITVTLVEPSGLRQVLFDNRVQTLRHQAAA